MKRTLLVLGRVSNVPTVWSNCLAGWLLATHKDAVGTVVQPRFLLLAGGCTLLYIGGMYLNDVFDVAFDTKFRPERPIPAGEISRRLVAILGCAWLLAGTGLLIPISGAWALALPVLIILYDAVHKQTTLAPVIMAACRFCIYPIAAASTGLAWATNHRLWTAAAVMAGWIVAVSAIARWESTGAGKHLGKAVAYLLAAIPLVDLIMISPRPVLASLPFAGFTFLAIIFGQSIPAS